MVNIFLAGMPGSGKSTLGGLIALELGRPFYDTDATIESEQGKTVSEIFAADGEPAFRAMERRVIERLSGLSGIIAATGGGAPVDPKNVALMKQGGIIVFINRPLELIAADIKAEGRPLLKGGMDRLFALYEQRIGIYKACADIEILNESGIEDAVKKAVGEVRRYEAAGD